MPTLSRELRKLLERTVVEAREVAEDAAEKALETLAVGEAEGYRTMNTGQKALRNRLRARGKQLGDWRNEGKETQDIDRLVSECAYEQWHRMLFARFLAENDLLLEPRSEVAVTIDDVKDLAQEQGRDWVDLSGEFAVRMLPQVFRQGDPVLEVQFAPEDRRELDELLASLPAEVFTASDSLGWTYQFWQTERKNQVNASENKIGADELPAVTQLFTEDYMVDFLLDNTLGAWHAGKVFAANPKLAADAESEDELRQAAALPGCPWKYLRFIKGKDGQWTLASGTFDGWPKTAKALKCLDPCMGSGHFVVAMFERLVALRVAEEKLNEAAAVAAVIRDNLFGLEIDPRCTQIGAFNLALAAWRRVGHCPLPAMNLACSGLAPNATKDEWVKVAGDNEALQKGMGQLHALFKEAPILGSLIDPRAGEADMFVAAFGELQPLLEKALAQEGEDDNVHELAVTASGVAKAAEILAGKFTLVATNVPYLGSGNQTEALKAFCEQAHGNAKNDLATCFIERSLQFCAEAGATAVVTPQSWLFLVRYRALREYLLKHLSWASVARLGTGAFETISGEVVNTALVILRREPPSSGLQLYTVNCETSVMAAQKAAVLVESALTVLAQQDLLKQPDFVFSTDDPNQRRLSTVAAGLGGITTGDSERFRVRFWEITVPSDTWCWFQGTVDETVYYGGRHFCLRWEGGGGALHAPEAGSTIAGRAAWNHPGIALNKMGALPATLYGGDPFENVGIVISIQDIQFLAPVWCFCESGAFGTAVREIDKSLGVTCNKVVQVPFDVDYWQRVAGEKYPHGLPKPFSSGPTQWLFNGYPVGSDQPLQVAVARLLGYQWPRQTGSSFPDCRALGPDGLEKLSDDDGIACLAATKGEPPAAERLLGVLSTAWGNEWGAGVVGELLAQTGYGGKTLEEWLRDGFFDQHCALFHHRPFIWHIWDGLEDGFHALVNYHQLAAPKGAGLRTLEKLTFSYLGDWIARQKAEQKAGRQGADDKLAAAVHLQNELKRILEGEPPYDLFVRWKPLHEQAVGWAPDINDGVRMNIRPFLAARTFKGKSIFRKAPKIKWEKDRGKEPERSKREFPWFWGWDEETEDFRGGREFDGNRWNDLHYSTAVKTEARDRRKEKGR